MDAATLGRLQSLFDAALDLPAAARAPYLDTACGGDTELRAAVERLLRADARSPGGTFLGDAVGRAARDLAGARPPAAALGPYRLLRELGHGGMGTVWLAERADDAYRAQVAIKLVWGGFANPELERRFRAERQILADLRHEHIAHLLDGGDAPDGTPYLVMEYVAGEPITDHAARRALTLRQRLRLFRLVCEAVQHAHRSLIVHRDIKPSNILVTDEGVPKLVDFGIAKPLAPEAGRETTALVRLMTPTYASPEQLRGERITVATDVYSLGVLLFELLTGTPPFAAPGVPAAELERRILTEEPPAPSAALRRAGAAAVPGVAARELAGDLDTIVAKALRKEPERRYGSVRELSEDIERHLTGLPVHARPDTASYRLRKFMERHRRGVAMTAAVGLLFAGGGAFHTVQLSRERDVANAERASAEQVTAFLADIFRSADPTRALGDTITARQLLVSARQRLDSALTGQPRVRAQLLGILGGVYDQLGQYPLADTLIARGLRLTQQTEGTASPRAAHLLELQEEVRMELGHHADAVRSGRRALAIREALGDSAAVASSVRRLAAVYVLDRDFASATPLFTRALALQERRGNRADVLELTTVLKGLGIILLHEARYDSALVIFKHGLALWHSSLNPRDPRLGEMLHDIGVTYYRLDKLDSAVVYYRQALAIKEAAYGSDHPQVLSTLHNLADVLAAQHDFAQAIALHRRVLAGRLRIYGPRHAQVAGAMFSLGTDFTRMGDSGTGRARTASLDSAALWLRRSIAVYRSVLPENDENLYYPNDNLSTVLSDAGLYAEALVPERRALAIALKAFPPGHPFPAYSYAALGILLAHLGRDGEARPALERGVAMLDALPARDPGAYSAALERLADVNARQGQYAAASRLYGRALPGAEQARFTADPPGLAGFLEKYARALRAAGQAAAASPLEKRARALRSTPAGKPGTRPPS